MARRCAVVRPSFRPARLCCMVSSASAGRRLELHAEREPLLAKDLLDLVQALPAEVLGLEHVLLGLLDELAKRADAGVLQAVRAPHRKLQLVDVRLEESVELALRELRARGARALVGLRVDED